MKSGWCVYPCKCFKFPFAFVSVCNKIVEIGGGGGERKDEVKDGQNGDEDELPGARSLS